VKQTILKQTDLDSRLNALLNSSADYDQGLQDLVTEIDHAGLALEILDSESWYGEPRSERGGKANSIEEQFRLEVDRILIQDRESEASLARRMEFARVRFDRALERSGIDPEDLAGRLPTAAAASASNLGVQPGFPEEVLCRWTELHALRTELVERNLYLVLVNVERYAHLRVSRMDLIQEGASVLFRAADGFDWRRGLLFRTYAVHWLNQAFRSFLYNFGNTVRVPVYLQKAMKHVRDAVERLGDAPHSVKEIAKEADLGEKIVQSALGAIRSTQSIDASFGSSEDDGLSLRETLTTDDDEGLYRASMEDISIEDGVEMALDRLSERERYVIGLRFGLNEGREHTLAEIAALLGVSLERVRQIQVRAISKMNTPGLRKAVDPYLL
jgi:RNA polymerase primary sigma factor